VCVRCEYELYFVIKKQLTWYARGRMVDTIRGHLTIARIRITAGILVNIT